MKTFDRITDLIGGTPLLKLTNYIADRELGAVIYAKLEYFNPAGSAKDRIAKARIRPFFPDIRNNSRIKAFTVLHKEKSFSSKAMLIKK